MFGNSYVTFIIILICVLNFIREYQLQRYDSEDVALQKCGALIKPLSSNKELYRLLTAGFAHMSVGHLLMNLYCMYNLGCYIEMLLGHGMFLVLILGSIIVGNICALFIGNDISISAGLSGGIYGLLAFELKLILMLGGISAVLSNRSLMITILINLSFNFMPGVGWKAHLGGFIFGLLFSTIFFMI